MNNFSTKIDRNCPKIDQPESIKLDLKPHQLACLYRMQQFDQNCEFEFGDCKVKTNLGFLGDFPGSGKTITALSLIEITKEYQKLSFPVVKVNSYRYYGSITESKQNLVTPNGGTLIVVPNNLVKHWATHIEKYTDLTYEIVTEPEISKISPELLDIIICSAKLYNRFTDYHSEIFWDRAFIDEADSIHIPNTNYIFARFLWLISSTYKNIPRRKNNGFLKDLFYSRTTYHTISRYYQKNIIECEPDFVRDSFNLEPVLETIIDCDMPEHYRVIKNFVNSSVLNKISAGDIDGAILELGGSIENQVSIIDLLTKQFKNNIIKLETEISSLERLEISEYERKKQNESLEQKLKQLKSRQSSLIESINEISEKNCAICLDILDSPILINCHHLFCTECIVRWVELNTKCPLCREQLDSTKFIKIGKRKKEPKKVKTKLDAMKEIVSSPGQFLIFSDYESTFGKLSSELKKMGISCGTFSRDSALKSEKMLNLFKESKIKVLILDSRNNGAGLEITSATDVILFHKMEPHLELQTIGRAQRPGRTSRLKVWKLRYPIEN